MFLDAADAHQFLHRRIQHLGKASKMFQESVGNGVGILPGNAVKQQQLQGLYVRKAIHSLLQKPILQALPMAAVNILLHKSSLFRFVCLLFWCLWDKIDLLMVSNHVETRREILPQNCTS